VRKRRNNVVWQEKIKTWYNDHLRNVRFGRDSGIFLIFLLISTLFWLLNQLSKETTAQVRYPVLFNNSGEQRVIINDLPGYLLLEVRGQGYKLMKYKLKPWKEPLVIDLRSFPLRPEQAGDTRRFYLLSSYVKGFVNDHLGDRMVLESILPDTLRFVFDSLVKRPLPVIADITVVPARQYILKDTIRIVPDTVVASGPAMILDTLAGVRTVHREFREVEKSFEEELTLLRPGRVDLSADKVVLQVAVEQYTEAVYNIPIRPKNVPDSVVLRLFPSRVKVSFRVGLSRYKKLLPELFDATVDYHDLNRKGAGKLTIRLEKQPVGIEAVRLDPEKVEYLIEKKK
jgi:hypothetical protein